MFDLFSDPAKVAQQLQILQSGNHPVNLGNLTHGFFLGTERCFIEHSDFLNGDPGALDVEHEGIKCALVKLGL